MKLHELTDFLESLAPLHLQESYDNSGLIVGDPEQDISGVLLSLDCVESVLEEAKAKNCNVVVAHHPIVFSGLKSLTGKNYIERTVVQAIKEDIAIYAIHTNLDNIREGVNAKIAEKIGLSDLRFLALKAGDQEAGSGMVGVLAEAMNETVFLEHLKTVMQLPVIRHTELLGRKVQRVAVCGGAGSFLLPQAIRAEADFFVTADYKYHQFFDADRHLVIADIGHYESEAFTKELLYEFISQQFPHLLAYISEARTNPVRYFQ
ncbi:MAG: Nif3-like dinuclear metal center hexameric protein [Bacteroidota bacterium]